MLPPNNPQCLPVSDDCTEHLPQPEQGMLPEMDVPDDKEVESRGQVETFPELNETALIGIFRNNRAAPVFPDNSD